MGFLDDARKKLGDAVENVKDFAEDAVESVKDFAEDAPANMRDFADHATENVKGFAANAQETISEKVSEFKEKPGQAPAAEPVEDPDGR